MTLKIDQIPISDRPREKLFKYGASYLTTAELIAVLLGCGTKKHPVLDLAHQIVAKFGTAHMLASATVEELQAIPGVGRSKALLLKAAFGLTKKLSIHPHTKPPILQSPMQVYLHIHETFSMLAEEHLVALFLDVKSRLIRQKTISIGTISEVLLHPREIFHPAIRHKASSVIVTHNHPSGDPTPSRKDIEVTKKLQKAGEILSIPLRDHLIIGANSYISLREKGCF